MQRSFGKLSRKMQVPGDCRRLAPTKTFLLSCEIDVGREVDVPAVCDILNPVSCTLSRTSSSRCACFAEVFVGARFQVMLGFFPSNSSKEIRAY